MKYVKMLGLLALAATALMVFAGSASAKVTAPKEGETYTGELHATSTGTQLDGSVTITCAHSSARAQITGGATFTALTTLFFAQCGKDTVTVLNKGSLSIASNHTATSNGAEVTVLTHFSIFNITVHCIYKTNNTSIGKLTTSNETGGTAMLDIGSSPIPQVETDALCGSNAEWTGSYTVTTPDSLYID